MTSLSDYPLHSRDKLRYGDTDRQGHINNAVFATFCETGRVDLLYNPDLPVLLDGQQFVIARLTLDFIDEILWPGWVEIGTRVERIGRSSITLTQVVFQGPKLVAKAENIVVLTDIATRKSTPLGPAAIETLMRFAAGGQGAVAGCS